MCEWTERFIYMKTGNNTRKYLIYSRFWEWQICAISKLIVTLIPMGSLIAMIKLQSYSNLLWLLYLPVSIESCYCGALHLIYSCVSDLQLIIYMNLRKFKRNAKTTCTIMQILNAHIVFTCSKCMNNALFIKRISQKHKFFYSYMIIFLCACLCVICLFSVYYFYGWVSPRLSAIYSYFHCTILRDGYL